MSLSILNNVAALYAQNNISATQSNLQKTLQQLSSGTRINSGADDPSGLAVSDGLNANESALTQSATNATEGIGLLQTADGALSQVTSLLNQAITIATEIGGGTLTGTSTTGQIGAANQTYANILKQITNIGSTTEYNSTRVFNATGVSINVSDGTTNGTANYADTVGQLTTSTIGTSAGVTGSPAPVAVTGGDGSSDSVTYTITAGNTFGGTLDITGGHAAYSTTVLAGTSMTELASQLANDTNFTGSGAGQADLTITALSPTSITITGTSHLTDASASFNQVASGTTPGTGVNLATSYSTIDTTNSVQASGQITAAIAAVAYQRGTLGADINELSSAASVASAEQVNLASAQNAVTATDYGQAASNLSKYQILSQTGISALAQANSVQQEVLKLLQ